MTIKLNRRAKTNKTWDFWSLYPVTMSDRDIKDTWPLDPYFLSNDPLGREFTWILSIKRTKTRVLAVQHFEVDCDC